MEKWGWVCSQLMRSESTAFGSTIIMKVFAGILAQKTRVPFTNGRTIHTSQVHRNLFRRLSRGLRIHLSRKTAPPWNHCVQIGNANTSSQKCCDWSPNSMFIFQAIQFSVKQQRNCRPMVSKSAWRSFGRCSHKWKMYCAIIVSSGSRRPKSVFRSEYF